MIIEALGCVPLSSVSCTMKHDVQDILHWADFGAGFMYKSELLTMKDLKTKLVKFNLLYMSGSAVINIIMELIEWGYMPSLFKLCFSHVWWLELLSTHNFVFPS